MLLSPEAIFKDKPLQQLAPFFKTKLSVTQRARWRWIFPEPDGGSIYPRARARNEIMDSVSNWHSAEELSEEAATMVQLPHHRASVFHVGPKAAEDWAQFCLRTTNNEYDKVPAVPMTSPTSFNSIEVWLKMMKLAHSEALLKPGAMHALEAWATRATSRQREALSNLCLLLSDFVSTGGSSLLSETKLKYAPKSVPPREAAVPPEGQLGRPSTAPIVSAVQLKLEAKMKAANEMSVRLAVEMKNKRDRENARSGGVKKPIDPSKHPAYASTIPMKWPMKPPTLITTQHVRLRPPLGLAPMACTMQLQSTHGRPHLHAMHLLPDGPSAWLRRRRCARCRPTTRAIGSSPSKEVPSPQPPSTE